VRLRQPSVLGEILAGILLGPTVLGALAPEWSAALFPEQGAFPVALEGVTSLAIALFLLVAGMEVDLSTVWRQGRAALTIGLMGMIVPFVLGFGAAWGDPDLLGAATGTPPFVFALFLATALSISALPVISKILMDLNLFRSDIGMIIIAAAIMNDLLGWIIFALVLSLMGGGATANGMGIGTTVVLLLAFTAFVLTAGRWILNRLLPWIQANTSWPAGVLGLALAGALFSAAFTEWIGVHAIFGAFLFGVAIGDSPHLRERTRATLERFIAFIFAPLFFATIGLRVDFAAHFDAGLVLLVLVLATAGKVLGCRLGARWSGLRPRETWAIGLGLNARGAMEIILGLLALEAGVIRERMFVALVIMALVTSMASGSAIQAILKPKRSVRFFDFLSARGFAGALSGPERHDAIAELSRCAAACCDATPESIFEAVWAREMVMSTSLNAGIAVPHARLPQLKTPVVTVGRSPAGIDFDAMDGQPTHIVFLILTPAEDYRSQLEILADVGRTFQAPAFVEKCVAAANYTEFLALVKSNE